MPAAEMNAGLDTGPFYVCAVAVAVLDPDFATRISGIFPPLIQMFERARSFRLGLGELGDS